MGGGGACGGELQDSPFQAGSLLTCRPHWDRSPVPPPLLSAQSAGRGWRDVGGAKRLHLHGQMFPYLDLDQSQSPSPRPRNTTWRKPVSLFRGLPRFAFPDLGVCDIPGALLRVSLFISCLNQTALLWGWCRGAGTSVCVTRQKPTVQRAPVRRRRAPPGAPLTASCRESSPRAHWVLVLGACDGAPPFPWEASCDPHDNA